jgi:hypothetical protein
MVKLSEYINACQDRVRESAGSLNHNMGNAIYERFVRTALRKYSQDKPQDKTNRFAGTGTRYIEINSTNLPNYIDGFSIIKNIEVDSPVIADDDHPVFIERDNWDYYRDNTKLYIYLKDDEPSASYTLAIHYTIPHTIQELDGATVDSIPSIDFEAIIYWASAEGLQTLANRYADTIDPTIRSDVNNYRSKSSEFSKRSQEYRDLYKNWIEKPYGAASVTRDIDFGLSFGDSQPYLTHRSFSRS